MGWFKTSVEANDTAIFLRKGIGSSSMEWDDVKSVYAEKVDKVTYEEIFLILEAYAGSVLEIGELDKGFDGVRQRMLDNLSGFPMDWRTTVESGCVGKRHLIWTRAQSD